MFGYWSYHGGHYTPPGIEIMKLMKAAGARGSAMGSPKGNTPEAKFMAENKWRGGSNPWPVLVPCHRVLGTRGKLTGFSAPG